MAEEEAIMVATMAMIVEVFMFICRWFVPGGLSV